MNISGHTTEGCGLVLGEENVLLLNMVDKVLLALGNHPEILGSVKLPSTMVMGNGSLEGFAAILGKTMSGTSTIPDMK